MMFSRGFVQVTVILLVLGMHKLATLYSIVTAANKHLAYSHNRMHHHCTYKHMHTLYRQRYSDIAINMHVDIIQCSFHQGKKYYIVSEVKNFS